MAATHWFTISYGGVGPYTQGQTIAADDLASADVARLVRLGAIRPATEAEITVAAQQAAFDAGDLAALRLPDDPADLVPPVPFSSGAPVAAPGPRDDPTGAISQAAQQAAPSPAAADADTARAAKRRT